MAGLASRWLERSLLVLVSLGLSLALAELGFRVRAHLINRGLLHARDLTLVPLPADHRASLAHLIRLASDPLLIYELRPGLDVMYKGAPVHTNSDGFRGPEIALSKRSGRRRIVGLGDSFMFGHGVADDETYLVGLQRQLGSSRVEVVNTAVPGYNTVLELATLRRKGLALDPDLVIIDFVGNDLSLPNFIRVPYPVLTVRHSFLWDRVRQTLLEPSAWTALRVAGVHGLDYRDANGMAYATDPVAVPEEYRHMVGWGAFDAAMRELADLSEEHGFEVLWITLDPGEGGIKGQAMATAARLGIPVLDIGARLQLEALAMGFPDFEHSSLALAADDAHPSPGGHAIAADLLTETVRRRFEWSR